MDALFDTGTTRSFVDVGVAEKPVYSGFEKPKEVLLAAKDGKACVIGELTVRVTVEGFELPLSHVFGVIGGLRYPIVGMDVMESYELALDVKTGKVLFRGLPPTLEIV